MAKTVPPGRITLPSGASFIADAVPDPFDERDLEYRPRLEPLPARLDQRHPDDKKFVLTQVGNSCTGHAVAAMINTVLAASAAPPRSTNGRRPRKPVAPRVSPYMLYDLARRYDEWEGEDDEGSSLRGLFKGWFHHGLALEEEWDRLNPDPYPDLEDPAFIEKCRDRPLGAFYRINPYRLDDMQSAIRELNAVAASAVIHDGWSAPVPVQHGRETMFVIARPVNARARGGHAFAIVGYNQIGFLIQNSWGSEWGKGGYATLPYEDWLDSAYDAWVARHGVPRTPFASGRTRSATGTAGEIVTAPGPDLRRLAVHVVNLGNGGRLSTNGKFISTPAQIEKLFTHMGRWHDFWQERRPGSPRHVLLYAHGGTVSEAAGLEIAQKQLNWWLNNRVYPISFAWQSGAAETLINQLADSVMGKLPFGGLGFDLVEQFDRYVEKVARAKIRWLWDEMKENARAASKPIENPEAVSWPPPNVGPANPMAAMPGASLTVTRLKRYVDAHGAENVRVHLVGHSAGSIFHAALLQRLIDAGIRVDSMTLLAPAIRVDEFERDILPHLGAGNAVARFATFAMSDPLERDDAVGVKDVEIYHKSLLYLVSRALERAVLGQSGEVPLLGMEKFFDLPRDGQTLRQAIVATGGAAIFSRAAAPDDSRSDATTHGSFDDNGLTMTSVVMRVLGVTTPEPQHDYQANAPLAEPGPEPPAAARAAAPTEPEPAAFDGRAAAPAFTPAAAVHPPGETPLVETAKAQTDQPSAPPQEEEALSIEVAVAPRSGSPILDVLAASGWSIISAGVTSTAPAKQRRRQSNGTARAPKRTARSRTSTS